MKSAERRHHYYRLKEKRIRDNYWGIGTWRGREDEDILAAMATNTPCTCSGDGCGNPRHNKWNKGHAKLTNQEKKSEIDYQEQIDDYYDWYFDDGYWNMWDLKYRHR